MLWKHRRSAWSDALLCNPTYGHELKKQWRTMCKRAVTLLQRGQDGVGVDTGTEERRSSDRLDELRDTKRASLDVVPTLLALSAT